jgi:Flp pilus assembly protein TadG
MQNNNNTKGILDRLFSLGGDSGGVLTLEYVLLMPLMLTLILVMLQLSHIYTARLITHYAAYCSTRSLLVCEESEYSNVAQAVAENVCSWVNMGGSPPSVDTAWAEDADNWNVGVEVTYRYPLILPLASTLFADGRANGFPYMTLNERAWLPKPYTTMTPSGF